jgi:hypothetical protein
VSTGLGYRRRDLQGLAEAKLFDALILADAGRYSNAYYLAGYSIELALKACISRQFMAETIPDPALARRVYDHDFGKLVGLAGLSDSLNAAKIADPTFGANWSTVAEWSEASRYEDTDRYSCGLMLEAVRNEPSGVLTWRKKHW